MESAEYVKDVENTNVANASASVKAGTLYLCATPIGNLEDMTYRAIRTLREVDLIAAEDTRESIRLLNHFDIKTPMTSYHEFNKYDKAKYLVDRLSEGLNVAVITDAGTPGISDPGEELVKQCVEAGIKVISIPGASACISALVISGQKTGRFCFEAFLPANKRERADILRELQDETRTIVIYEAPHRLIKTLGELYEALGNRSITICKELTKIHENAIKTELASAAEEYAGIYGDTVRGEHVLVIEGRNREDIRREEILSYESMTVEEHVKMYIDRGMDKKMAMKEAAKDRGISKRDIYNAMLTKNE